MSTLRLEKISKRYGDFWAVRDAEFEVGKGEIFGLVGASGSGKTAILRMIAGLETPNLGKILFAGEDITKISQEKRGFGFLGQDAVLYPRYSVAENIGFELKARKVAKSEYPERISEALLLVKLKGYEQRKVATLSNSETERVALAKVFAAAPAVLLLDDPLAKTDKHLRSEICRNLLSAIKEKNLAAVYVTQNQAEAFGICDKIGVLERGDLLQIGTPQEIYESPETVAVARFWGRNNLIEVRRISKSTDNYQEFQTISGSHRIFADLQSKARLGAINQNVFLAIRPENLVMTFGAAFPEDNLLKATVKAVSYQGATTRVMLDCNGLFLEALVLRLIGLKIGDECIVGLPPNRISILKG